MGNPLLSKIFASRHRLRFFPRSASKEASIQVPSPVLPKLTPDQTSEAQSLGSPVAFTDIGPDYWAKPLIDELSAHGLIAGFPDGSFQPDRPITRLELAVQIAILFQLVKQPASGFKDIAPTHWAYSSIQAATQMGFLKGYPENQFQPEATISKAELLVAIASGLQLSPVPAPAQRLHQFQDHDQVPSWAAAQIAATMEAGIIVNYPHQDYLNPQAAATRAEAAAILYQSLVYLGQLKHKPFPYTVPTHF